MIDSSLYPEHHHFEHEAMMTTFSLRICAESEQVARGMSYECFDLIDSLENRLSRFVEGSDVHRINSMQAGETLYLTEPCYECLLQAIEASAETGGLFDVTLGTRVEHRKSGSKDPIPPLQGKLIIHPDAPAISCDAPGREIDLGGIGKGFALDELRKLLLDWGAEGALLSSGASTLLAFGPAGWPIDLAGAKAATRITLRDGALSASGTGIQGSHIVHPDRGDDAGLYEYPRIWVLSPSAAQADAWSTAVMLMSPAEIAEALTAGGALQQVYVDRGEDVSPDFSRVRNPGNYEIPKYPSTNE